MEPPVILMLPDEAMVEKGITQLSLEIQKHSVKYAWCTTLWQYSATAYGKSKNRNCSTFWARMREGEYLYFVIIRRGVANICRFVNENLIANFIPGIQYTFLSDRWLKISADFFISWLDQYWGEKWSFFKIWFMLLD